MYFYDDFGVVMCLQLDIASAQRFQQQQMDALMKHAGIISTGVPQSAPCMGGADQQMGAMYHGLHHADR